MSLLSTIISVRIDKELKKEMDKLSYINWSEVIRQAIEKKIEEEKSKIRERDIARIKRASEITRKLRRRIEGWSSVEEIRRWRESRG